MNASPMDRDRLFRLLRKVEQPARYIGGEFGQTVKTGPAYRIGLCFPDLYELGMSNQALAVLYRLLNGLEGVACERVFAPGRDLEALLRREGLPLFTLETLTPLADCDMLGFSVGYELLATNILAVLETGGVAPLAADRLESDPVVMAGGPSITNPHPFGRFFDAVFIGEAEAEFPALAARARDMKSRGAGRSEILGAIRENRHVWHSGKTGPTGRAVYSGFSGRIGGFPAFPVPNVRTVHDHGSVEIMRGCPHGCRFCHAGIFYRPLRIKPLAALVEEIDRLVSDCGYREISLSSLSSGDFPDILDLVRFLNARYAGRGVSFSLPSLKIESFGLSVMEEISSVRKSGLTFAVEVPGADRQAVLNKLASIDKVLAMLDQARGLGWKTAKFYFMIGLPGGHDEPDGIVGFMRELAGRFRLNYNVNVGTFVPKPHTPFQWERQFSEDESVDAVRRIKKGLAGLNCKLGYHAPFQSFLEGVISRGDERVGELILSAYRQGARFDAWDDKSDREVWRTVLGNAGWDVKAQTCSPRDVSARLAWDDIKLVSRAFLEAEREKAAAGALTEACSTDCSHPCGACRKGLAPPSAGSFKDAAGGILPFAEPDLRAPLTVLFAYSKRGTAAFIPHLGLLTVFERALARAGLQADFTKGFNPKPIMEFAQPLPVAVESEDEYARMVLRGWPGPDDFMARMNQALPEGLRVKSACLEKDGPPDGLPSLMSLFRGARYELKFVENGNSETRAVEINKSADGNLPGIVKYIQRQGWTEAVDWPIVKTASLFLEGTCFLPNSGP